MFCQLGSIVFNSLSSFSSFACDQEVTIVEHELINRNSFLEPTAVGLRQINIAVHLYSEFCNVAEIKIQLHDAQRDFKILPLLWGNGQLEGHFIIKNISSNISQMDSTGNTISESISISLIECSSDDLQQQDLAQAQKDAFALGDKNPPAKSKIKNPESCNKRISALITDIKSNGGIIDTTVNGYTNNPLANSKISIHGGRIIDSCKVLEKSAGDKLNCASKVTGIGETAQHVRSSISKLMGLVSENVKSYPNLYFTPLNLNIKSENNTLQLEIRNLTSISTSLLTSNIIKK